MNLHLGTIDIWTAETPQSPSAFFGSLHHLLDENDILAIGSYDLDQAAEIWFSQNAIPVESTDVPYDDSFELNREEYPRGRAWHFRPTREIFSGLASLVETLPRFPHGPTCIDHILAYRAGIPALPLLNFRHAFGLGDLHLSGHFSEATIRSFALDSELVIERAENPVLASVEC
ncbi:MAG: hypothetical protein EOP84_27315 [Verrucomicrobiaceae bacterium]|nr:MAG: hypothetical protein EOP84_27315 [Verrucomicrobiaceae bacterium]